MKIGILGSGTVGQTIGARLAALGHDLMLGSRSPEKLSAWAGEVGVKVGDLSATAAHGELLFNATRGDASIAALRSAGEANLNARVLIDVANPLDFSAGMPPGLLVSGDDSLGEQIQRAFPGAKVVKTLNTMNAAVMVSPSLVGDGDQTLFVRGNDPAAQAEVGRLLAEWFGWRDILDLGDISTAREVEAIVPLWVLVMMKLGRPTFQFKIVR
jgi:hypothetical protein